MNSTLKRAIERAMQPAIERVDREASVPGNKWGVESIEDMTRKERKIAVAHEAVKIVMLRRGRTMEQHEQMDATDYAKTLVN